MLKLAAEQPTSVPGFMMSEVVSAMSYALDIVEGQPEGHAIRSCMIGMRIAQELGFTPERRSALFYALLLKDLGCSSNAAKICYLFGADDHGVKQDFKTTNWTSLLDRARYVARNVEPDGTILQKLGRFCTVAFSGSSTAKQLVKVRCERGAMIARDLDLPEETVQAIRNLDEHWDGQGHPDGLRKTEIPLLARILGIAQTVEVFASRDGIDTAFDIAKQRSKTWFDPNLVKAFRATRNDTEFWTKFKDQNVREHVAALEPEDRVMHADQAMLDRIATAFGKVIDAKSPWTACHSQGVSDVAVGISTVLGQAPEEIRRIRRAGLLHDIGKLGISNLILDKPGKLTSEEFEDMKLHPAYTLRILERASCFHEIADLAASHHERLDGKGYFRGLDAAALSTSARTLVVADMYEALAAKRPYRKDLSEGEVFEILAKNAGAGICPCVLDALKTFIASSWFVPYSAAA